MINIIRLHWSLVKVRNFGGYVDLFHRKYIDLKSWNLVTKIKIILLMIDTITLYDNDRVILSK